MNKIKLPGKQSDPRFDKQIVKDGKIKIQNAFRNSKSAFQVEEEQWKNQNSEYISLQREYMALHEELTASLSQIVRMNEDMYSAQNKLEESERLKAAFLANILHETRTPMNAIIGFSDLLMDNKLSKVKTGEFVKIINASCRKLNAILSDIIDISKIDADQSVIDKELVNINFLLDDVYSVYSNQSVSHEINFVYEPKSEFSDLEILTDRNKVRQVLNILIDNALKFTSCGEIKFGFNIIENFIAFYIKDTGIGIAPKDQKIIFDRFRQVDNSDTRLYGGNGLGLSIAKALVEKMGGIISVNSEDGKGATFIFTLPYQQLISTENEKKAKTIVNWADKTILVVEDEIFNHIYIENALSDTKINIVHAWNGEKAIEMVEKYASISLVLMDLKMPVIDGYEAIQRIKVTNPKLPVIAITAYALSHNKEEAMDAGFDNYISKPIHKETLVEVIAGCLK